MKRAHKNFLLSPLGVFVLVLVLYVPLFSYFFFIDNAPYAGAFPIRAGSDGSGYVLLAENLIQHHGFSGNATPPFLPETLRTPGYPAFIAGIKLLFGSLVAVSFVQILLTACTTALLYSIARTMLSKPLAFLVALSYGLNLNTITLSINVLSDSLFVFLVVASVYTLFVSRYAKRPTVAFCTGLILGAAILVRPIGLFLPVLYALLIVMTMRRMDERSRILKCVTLLLVGCAIMLMPWVVRNGHLTGHWSLSSSGMFNVLVNNVSSFLADTNRASVEEVRAELVQKTGVDPAILSQLGGSDRVSAVALAYLERYPLQYASYHLLKEGEVFAQSGLSYFLNEAPKLRAMLNHFALVDVHGPNVNQLFTRGDYRSVLRAFSTQPLIFLDRFFWISITLLAVASVFMSRKDDLFWHRMFFLSLVFYLPFFSAPIGEVRYRVPAEPFMFILAVWAAQRILNTTHKRLKMEFYYMKRMLKQRRGLLQWHRYIWNKFFSLQLLHRMKPVTCDLRDDFEVHILTPKNGLWMAYWTIRTFLHHSELHPRIIVHDDGTIDEQTARMFEEKLLNVRILRRVEADRRFYADPNIPDIIKRYRRTCPNVLLLMFIDHFFLSSSRRVLVLDNDILFYDRPTEIINFFHGNSAVDAVYAVYGDGRNPLDVDEGYQRAYSGILDDASRLNSGLMMFDKPKVGVRRIAEYFEHVTKPDGHLIEQTGWGMVLSQIPHAFFPEDKYKLKGRTDFPAVCKHFTTPRRHELFAYGIDEARERIGA